MRGWCHRLENWETWWVSSWPIASWVPQEANTEPGICIWRFSGESSQQHLCGSKRTRKWQKKLNGDTYSCNSGLSLSCMKFWSWDDHLGMFPIEVRELGLWTWINQSLDAGCPWGWGNNLGWSIFLHSSAVLKEGCTYEPSDDDTPGSWGNECCRCEGI